MKNYLKRWHRQANETTIYIRLLYSGALLGMLVALVAILTPDPSVFATNKSDVVVTVNDVGILNSRYQEQLDAVRSDRRDDLSDEIRKRVLDRLIDEELLIQNGLDIGFAQSDRSVRGAIVNAVIATILAEVEAEQPDESELKAFYEKNKNRFKPEDRLLVRRIVIDQSVGESPLLQAGRVIEELKAGWSFQQANTGLAGPREKVVPIPAGPLPLTELRKYLGPSVVEKLATLGEGEFTEPLPMGQGFQIFLVEERLSGKVPAFEKNRAVAEQAYRQAAGAQALNDYLAMLKERATISFPQEE